MENSNENKMNSKCLNLYFISSLDDKIKTFMEKINHVGGSIVWSVSNMFYDYFTLYNSHSK